MVSNEMHKKIMQKKLDLNCENVEEVLEILLNFYEDEDEEGRIL